jgi:hypothetical protein
MRSLVLPCIAALLIPLAGCITSGPDLPGGAPTASGTLAELKAAAYAEIQALMAGVPCEVSDVGAGTSANLKTLSNVSFAKGGTQSLDTHGDLMIAANGGSGMAILNITNPLQPTFYSNYTESKSFGDVKLSPDNLTAVAGVGGAIDLVDIRDPYNPVRTSQWKLASAPHTQTEFLNAHMLYTAAIKGEQWVFLAPNNNEGVWILRLVGAPDKRELQFVTSTLPVEGGPLGPHDMWVTYDADLQKWLLYSADGYHGWAVFDVSDPAKPALAGGLVRPESGYTHTIQAAKINGKRIVATIAEVGFNVLEVYDASNLMAPVLLATWQVSEEGAPQAAAPQHEFNIVAGKLYLGHYANGFYVFDLTKISMPVVGTASLTPVAHYAVGTPGPATLFSDIWSVDVINGVLYASSMAKGILVVGYGCNEAGDAALTSTG